MKSDIPNSTDRIASELAIQRLTKEIDQLEDDLLTIGVGSGVNALVSIFLAISSCVFMGGAYLVYQANKESSYLICMAILGLFGLFCLYMVWNSLTTDDEHRQEINAEITTKQAELRRHQQNVR